MCKEQMQAEMKSAKMKPVLGFEGKYAVTSDGRVYSHRTKRFMALSRAADGYLVVNLWDKGTKTKKVHLLVLEAFRGLCPKNCFGLHRSRDRTDNSIANLRWGPRC